MYACNIPYSGLMFVLVLLLIYAIMFLLVWRLEYLKARPKPHWVAMRQAKEFCIWVILSAQVLGTAASATAAGLPSWAESLYEYFR